MKLQLPNTTLCIVDCINANRATKVIEICKKHCDFGAIKLLTHIPIQNEYKVKIIPLNSLVAYSIFVLTRLHKYIDTEKILIVQRDGWILNPQSWDDRWNIYDFIGPLFVQYDKTGSGGFSFRSTKMMQAMSETMVEWDGTQKHADEIQKTLSYYEDGEICLTDFGKRFNIAPLEVAANFAMGGNRNPDYYRPHPFGYHGNWSNIDHSTGFVSPVCEHEKLDCQCNADHVKFLQENE